MFIRLSDIEDGAVLKGKIDCAQFKREEDKEFAFLTPVDYEITVLKFENNARVEGAIACSLSLTCGRCMDVFPFQIKTYLDVELVRKAPIPDSELELTGEDMDIYWFEGDEIDMDPLVYEEVLLNIPMKPLCMEDCKGLCDTCGKNRNVEDCRCDKVSNTLLEEKLNVFLTLQGDENGSSKKKNFSIKKG